MADIKQAAVWMVQGYLVRRNPKNEPSENFSTWRLDDDGNGLFTEDGDHPIIYGDDLLADDWEIVK